MCGYRCEIIAGIRRLFDIDFFPGNFENWIINKACDHVTKLDEQFFQYFKVKGKTEG